MNSREVTGEALTNHDVSVIVFRLGNQWFALPTLYLKEVTPRRPVHRIPHRTNKVLKGFVNLNGELNLLVSLHDLMQIESCRESLPFDRMISMIKDEDIWVFPVDEIEGIYRWDLREMQCTFPSFIQSDIKYIKGVMEIGNKRIGLLDEQFMFEKLKKWIQ